jgi:hypothetical protein
MEDCKENKCTGRKRRRKLGKNNKGADKRRIPGAGTIEFIKSLQLRWGGHVERM